MVLQTKGWLLLGKNQMHLAYGNKMEMTEDVKRTYTVRRLFHPLIYSAAASAVRKPDTIAKVKPAPPGP
jgi:hypothetical protein